MRTYIAFTKKEFTENLRTYKFLIMVVVFLIFGAMSPLLAKFTPELLKMSGLSASAASALGVGTPTMIDSWAQFFKNVGQLGLLVVAIVFSGIMANEFTKGTLINMLTKGLKRSTVIFSKLTVAVTVWTLAYLLCLGTCWGYTAYYFAKIGMSNVFISFFSLWLFGVLLIALLIFGGVMFKGILGSLLTAGGAVVVLSIINIIPKFQKYNPATLSGDSMSLLTAHKALSDVLPATIICGVLILLLVTASIWVFRKKQV